jgi:hypothetical protein
MAQRYGLRRDPEGTWSVIDMFTGQRVTMGEPFLETDFLLRGLGFQDADGLADLLNRMDKERRRQP